MPVLRGFEDDDELLPAPDDSEDDDIKRSKMLRSAVPVKVYIQNFAGVESYCCLTGILPYVDGCTCGRSVNKKLSAV